jgi:nucleotide-binding universal stress UspA family protein
VAWWEKDVAAAKAYLARVADRLRVGKIGVISEVVVGNDTAGEIAAYARRENADLIAIATHGRGGLARVLRGSVADALTRCARTCILVFHPIATVPTSVIGNDKRFAEQH